MSPEQTQPENLSDGPADREEDESDPDDPRTAEVTELEKPLITNVRLEVERVSDAEETEEGEKKDERDGHNPECIGN